MWRQRRGLVRQLGRAQRLAASAAPGVPIGTRAPEFDLPDLHGNRVTLAHLLERGRPLLMVFVTPGCEQCVELLPKLSQWQRTLADRVTLVFMSTGSVKRNKPIFEEHGISDDVLLQEFMEVSDALPYPGNAVGGAHHARGNRRDQPRRDRLRDRAAPAHRAERRGPRRRPEALSPSRRSRALEEFAVRHGAGDSALRRELDSAAGRLFEAFTREGVDALLLKGAALAHLLYDVPEQRSYQDLDLLVDPDDLPDARAALAGLGYKNVSELMAVDDIGGDIHGESWLAEFGVVADLHLRLAGAGADARTAWEALRARSTIIELGGSRIAGSRSRGRGHAPGHPRRAARRGLRQGDQRAGAGARPLAARHLARRRRELADEMEATEAFASGLRLVEAGAELAETLGLPSTSRLDWELRQSTRPRGRSHLHVFLQAPDLRTRAHVLRRALLPHPRWIVQEYPWARDRRGRILAAYLLHIAPQPCMGAEGAPLPPRPAASRARSFLERFGAPPSGAPKIGQTSENPRCTAAAPA